MPSLDALRDQLHQAEYFPSWMGWGAVGLIVLFIWWGVDQWIAEWWRRRFR